MSDVTLETICETQFGGCKGSDVKMINYTTPKGHEVEAIICRKPNRFLGSLYICTVDGEDTGQFVASMPKLHYLDNYHQLDDEGPVRIHFGHEKLDGTCVILYPLLGKDGEVLEVVPKSRNMGVLDKNFQSLYDQCDTKRFEDYLMQNPYCSLLFELYGMGNKHEISHMDTYLDMKYLGASTKKGLVRQSSQGFGKPDLLFTIQKGFNGDDVIELEREGFIRKYGAYLEDTGNYHYTCDSITDAVAKIKEELQALNEAYYKVNDRLALEGVVIQGTNKEGEVTYIKVKPDDIEKAHKSQNGIPRRYIMKEIMKYLDEYGSTAKETFEDNPEMIWDYINRNLAEEFEPLWIEKSQSKMKRWFEEKLYPPKTPEEIVEIGDKLISEYPDLSVTDYMRLFGQQYPDQKKQGGKLYKYLNDKLDGG